MLPVAEVEQRAQQFLGRLDLWQVAGAGQQRERRRWDRDGVSEGSQTALPLGDRLMS
jgi:hypothetical protein